LSQTPRNASSRVHLPGLNALRFYAAMSVAVAHISNNFGELRSFPVHLPLLEALALDAQSAVSLFFVLSGFLITYLLLCERDRTGGLSVPRFYGRRALRIWPLYYVTTFIGLVLLPWLIGPAASPSPLPSASVLLILFFLPNFVTGYPPLGHLWSIGLEEQFYIAWPWVVRNGRALVRVAAGIIAVKVLIAPVIAWLDIDSVTNMYVGLRFECMALGALGAYAYHSKHSLLSTLYSLPARAATLGGMVFLALVDVPLTEPVILSSSVLFTVLVLNVSTSAAIGPRLEFPAIEALGRMSYGIYMYHYPLLYLVLVWLRRAQLPPGALYNGILYASTLLGKLLLAALSYRFLEKPFLVLKDKLAVVPTQA